MKSIKKYLLLAFIIENVFAQTPYFSSLSFLFYVFLAFGMIFIFEGTIFRREIIASCMPLFLLGFVYVAYQFTLGLETISLQTQLYLIAKIATFIIIIVSVSSNWEFYATKAPKIFSVLVLLILLFNIATGNFEAVNDRQLLGFTNSNTTSSMAAFSFAGFLFFRDKKRQILYIMAMLLCFYALLAGGSRNGILIFAILFFMWRGASWNTILIAFVLFTFLGIVVSQFDIELMGLERLTGTLSGEVGTNRDEQREAAWIMIEEKPWTGWGFEAQNVGQAAAISELGSHSGYLETLKFMGYPFGLLWLAVLYISTFSMSKFYKMGNMSIRYHLAIVFSSLASAFFESLFVGVHELATNMMFISLAVLTIYKYRQKVKKKITVEKN